MRGHLGVHRVVQEKVPVLNTFLSMFWDTDAFENLMETGYLPQENAPSPNFAYNFRGSDRPQTSQGCMPPGLGILPRGCFRLSMEEHQIGL